MAGYTRQSTFADGDTITAALFNNEYNQLLNAFNSLTGHKHDGTTGEGAVIALIGDTGVATPLNKVLIDTTNDHIEFWIDVSSTSVQQLYIADGAIIPVTDSDIDLGTTSLRFKDTYTDTVTTTGNVSIGGDLTVTGSATISGNLTFGDADTDSINLAAEIDSDIIPNTDGTYDLGSATKEWQDLYIDGTANIDSLVADTADINGGTIDGATIATSDITVGSGKTLDVSSGTLTLADDQISGDKVEGGTIAATTITTLTSTTGNITNVNATTLDTTNIEVTNLKAKDGTSAGSIADSTGVVTLGSSVLTTTDINGGTIDGVTIGGTTAGAVTFTDLSDGTITIAGFADEDNMSSNSATLLPTQQSVKAYVDSQVTAQDLDFQGDTGGALSIDLDSESLTIAGGTGIDTSGATNTLTVAIDSTVATLTGTQTLTNKTLTSPDINTPDIDGGTIDGTVIGGTTPAAGTFTTLTANTSIAGTLATAAQPNITSVGTLSALTVTGEITANGGIALGNDDIATFGNSDELQIYYDGYVAWFDNQDSVEKSTHIKVVDDGYITLKAGNDNMIQAAGNSNVSLYYDGSPKLATTSTGIDVTGTATMDGLTVVGETTSSNGTYGTKLTYSNGNQSGIIDTFGNHNLEFRANDDRAMNIAANGDISFYDDTGTSQALFWDASAESLGIGGASTLAALETRGNEYSARFFGTTTSNGLQIYHDETNTIAKLKATNSGGDLMLEAGTASGLLFFNTAGSERLRIDSSGNVGIGTTSVDVKLHIGDTSASTLLKLERLSVGGTMGIDFNAGNNGSIFNNIQYGRIDVQSTATGGSAESGMMTFHTRNSGATAERMRIESSGNVGIGTDSPSQKLHVDGGNSLIKSSYDATGTTNSYLYFATRQDGNWRNSTIGNTGNALVFGTGGTGTTHTNATERMRIDSSGNVGIGTSPNTTFKLDVEGAVRTNGTGLYVSENYSSGNNVYKIYENSNEFRIESQIFGNANTASSPIVFATSNTDGRLARMTIDNSGNLLVGKDSDAFATAGVVLATSQNSSFTRNSGNVLALRRNTNDGDLVTLYKDTVKIGSISSRGGSTLGLILNSASGTGAGFSGTTNAIFPIDETTTPVNGEISLGTTSNAFNNLYLSGGAYLGGTGSANHLDDYEEGTWTPTFEGADTAGTYTYGSREARYTKIGRFVQVTAKMNGIDDVVEGSGSLHVTGLPFAVSSTTDSTSGFGAVVFEFFNVSDDTYNLACEAVEAASYVRFWESKDNTANALVSVTDRANDSADLWFSVAYETDA